MQLGAVEVCKMDEDDCREEADFVDVVRLIEKKRKKGGEPEPTFLASSGLQAYRYQKITN